MGRTSRAPLSDAPPAYSYVQKYYGRSLRPVVLALALLTAIWALAWTISSFRALNLANSDGFPKLAPLAIAQGVLYVVACAIQVFGIVAAATQRPVSIKLYAFLCALSTLLVIGVGFMRVVTHFVYKSELISECTTIAQTGSIGPVFGIWGSGPSGDLNEADAAQFCNDEWNHDSWAEIITLLLVIVLGLLFTSIAFAYYRQTVDPASPVNASRVPSDQTRADGYPTYYNPPYDASAYMPVYLPPPGPPPDDGKPPEYKRTSSYAPSYGYGGDKDAKGEDPFGTYDGPSVPMPTHWVEDRDVTSPERV